MKVVILLSLFVLAASRPQTYHYNPTPGPVYYKPINPQLLYPSYLQGQFRLARSDDAAAPIEAADEAPVEAAPREGRAEELVEAAPVASVEPVAPVQAVERAEVPAARSYPAPAPAYSNPAAYSYEWLVKDDYTKNDYGQKESRSGANTQGSYHVALPDGRIQTITYTVDGYGGYIANVQYSGEAQYPDTPAYKPAAKAYKAAPAPAYKPAPAPAYKPAPTPAYKPVPAPVYKSAPAPVYTPKPAPVYPIQPASSVRRYSFRTINDEPVPAEEARTAEGVSVEVFLDDEEFAAPVAPIEVAETARSDEGLAVEAPVFPEAPAAPVEAIIFEESARSNAGSAAVAPLIPEAPAAPVVDIVIEETVRSDEGDSDVAPIIPEAPAAPVEQNIITTEPATTEAPITTEAPAAPVEEEIETTTLVNLLAISESDNAPLELLEPAESRINEVVESRQQKALEEVAEEAVEEAAEEASAPKAVEQAPYSYRYYYRY